MQADGSFDLRVSAKGSSGVNREQQEEKDQEEKKVKREQRVFLKLRSTLPAGSQLNHLGALCSCCIHSRGHLCMSCSARLKATLALYATCPFSNLDHF